MLGLDFINGLLSNTVGKSFELNVAADQAAGTLIKTAKPIILTQGFVWENRIMATLVHLRRAAICQFTPLQFASNDSPTVSARLSERLGCRSQFRFCWKTTVIGTGRIGHLLGPRPRPGTDRFRQRKGRPSPDLGSLIADVTSHLTPCRSLQSGPCYGSFCVSGIEPGFVGNTVVIV
jgi:hypothetical protein